MKILRIIARLNVGGPARHVVWLNAGLQKAGFDTLLVAGVVPPGEDDMGYFAEEYGITPVIIPQMSREISSKDLLTVWKLYRLFVRERPDVIHTHTAKAGTVGRVAGFFYRWLTLGTLIGRPRRCHAVHTYHGHIFHGYYGPQKTRVFLMIERLLARLATDRIIVVSQQQLDEISNVFRVGRREQFKVIPLGIEIDQYAKWPDRRQRLRAELKAGDDQILVGIVGRLTEIKNHKLFLEAAAKYKIIAPNDRGRVRFLVVGDGSLRNSLEAHAQMLGLDSDVVFLGTRDDPEDFYPAFDIVALTSLNEGTPLTLIEAMANARPVVATSVGGVVDLLGSRTRESPGNVGYTICERGISVKSGDAEGFAHALKYLIEDVALRNELGRRGLEFVSRNYAKERLLQDIASLYGEIARNAPATSSAKTHIGSSTAQVAARRGLRR